MITFISLGTSRPQSICIKLILATFSIIKTAIIRKNQQKGKEKLGLQYKLGYNKSFTPDEMKTMDCIFCNIAEKKIPATLLYEDEQLLAFRDINPQAPVHMLVIPRKHIPTIDAVEDADALLVGRMITRAKELARQEGLQDGYRLVFNVNSGGGQEVYHIHLHILGGRQMTWPPG